MFISKYLAEKQPYTSLNFEQFSALSLNKSKTFEIFKFAVHYYAENQTASLTMRCKTVTKDYLRSYPSPDSAVDIMCTSTVTYLVVCMALSDTLVFPCYLTLLSDLNPG
uniref:Uncharacterized protein n=1 Tax=Schistocephalus solidus TaxID=70667 RepID=A0A0X3Q1F6_SCHSO